MLTKFYTVLGFAMCIGLGIAFATGTKAPDLGFASGTGSSHGGRTFFHSSGFHFGK
jgi:hypothetical protein